MAKRTYAIRWSFLGMWLVSVSALAVYVKFSVFAFALLLMGSICWYKIGIVLDRLEADMKIKGVRYISDRNF